MADGGFVVAWCVRWSAAIHRIGFKRYSSLGEKIRESLFETSDLSETSVAGLPNGGYVIMWSLISLRGNVYARQYSFDDTLPLGTFQAIKNFKADSGRVIAMPDSGYVITYRASNIFAVHHSAPFVVYESEFRVNTQNVYMEQQPAIAAIPGGYVIVWADRGQDGSGHGIYARMFQVSTDTMSPTSSPTKRPTPVPTSSPTRAPTAFPVASLPTPSPTSGDSSTFSCAPYSASNTNSARANTVSCTFYACADQVLTFSTCDGCSGDTYLRLYNAFNTELVYSDDSCGPGYCTFMTYTTSSAMSCQYLTLRQGCFGTNSCSGTTRITQVTKSASPAPTVHPTRLPTALPTLHPTAVPTLFPTPSPTKHPVFSSTRSPTPIPSPESTGNISYVKSVQCAPFNAHGTNDARENTSSCFFMACHNDDAEVSMCGGCSNDAIMRIYDAVGVEVAMGDDACGYCPELSFSRHEPSCSVYEIRQGCYEDSSCSGSTSVRITSHCAEGWMEYKQGCYSFNSEARGFAAAQSVCAESNSLLVSINSKHEAKWLIDATHDSWNVLYVGYSDLEHEGVWEWEDEVSTYANWGWDSPNGGIGENCAIMRSSGEMFDTACDNSFPFDCEYSCSFCATLSNILFLVLLYLLIV